MARVNTGSGWTTVTAGGGVASVDGETGTVILTDNYTGLLNPIAKNTAYTIARNDLVMVDCSTANVALTVPANPAVGFMFAVNLVIVGGGGFSCTVTLGGTDHFQTVSGVTSINLAALDQVLQAQYCGSNVWAVLEDPQPELAPGYATTPNTSVPGKVGIDCLVDVQNYSVAGSYTWNLPSWAAVANNATIEVECIGAGGGGGSGSRGATSTVRGGGGGGASGNRALQKFRPSDLTGSVTMTVGAGGPGGTAVSTDGNGVDGTAGGATSFGKYVVASGGGGGQGGQQGTDGGNGGTPGTVGMWLGVAGGKGAGVAAAAPGTASGPGVAGTAGVTSGSGGGGGGSTASNTIVVPAAGGNAAGYTDGSTLGGIASTGAGVIGAGGTFAQYGMASGAGGGSRGQTQNGSAGGNGGAPGGGAGGGGGSINTFNSGAGGTGGVGNIRVVTRA